jgi:hypothetical protein
MRKYIDELPNADVARKPIDVEMCKGCNKVFEGSVCKAYVDPSVFARRGGCALSSNRVVDVDSSKKVYKVKRKFKRAKI